ncbi:Uncharacterised protein [Legionella wadsworthii]|uniref:Uncharacterized protein n=1 Tax=Legionella wadsworthii TaxID=28088 RepID=A0A378LSC2_9GAMM|nr:hypothetical protein [Legionella wadsworthii]STY29865.1 Uncharacterised protein [Legionella wadsworthii]
MGFYFRSYRQTAGDKAYNEKKFEEALTHYSAALTTLHLHAASNATRHNDFYDAFVYVLSEVITTKLMIMSREAQNHNFAVMKSHWDEIPGLLQEMEITYEEHLKNASHCQSNKEEKVKEVNKLLAAVCEDVSDDFADLLDEEETIPNLLPHAIEWMKRAISFQLKTRTHPKLSSSLGYLNLLERLYKKTNNETHLKEMADYIQKYKLRELPVKSPLQKLELLSYVLRANVATQGEIIGLADECKSLYALLPDEDKDNTIIEDLRHLIDLGIEKDGETAEAMEESDDTSHIVNTEGENRDGESNEGHALPEQEAFVSPGDTLIGLQSLDTVPMSLSIQEDTTVCDSGIPHNSPVIEFSASPSTTQSPQGFFFSAPQGTSSDKELPHSKALQVGFETIISNAKNPKFLANLLSLIADFFIKYKAYNVQKQNAIVLAYDLYRQVLKIDPQHNRAHAKLREMSSKHKQLIGSYNKFFSVPQSPIPFAEAQMDDAKRLFTEALEDLTIQLESLLINKTIKIRITIDQLICYVGEQLTKGAITQGPSPEIEEMLTNTFEKELKNYFQVS